MDTDEQKKVRTYSVTLICTAEVQVEVEATDEDEAAGLAYEQVENDPFTYMDYVQTEVYNVDCTDFDED